MAAAPPDARAHHHHHHHDPDSLPFREAIAERLIAARTMRIELKLVLGLAVAQLLVAAVMVSLKNLSGGPFNPTGVFAFSGDEGDQFISAAAFTVGLVIMVAAWALVLAGAFRAGIVVRLVTLAAFGWAMWAERDALSGLPQPVAVLVDALLAVIVLLGVVSWFPERRLHAKGAPVAPSGAWRHIRRGMSLLLFLIVGGIYLAVWLASNQADQAETFSNDVFDQINNIEYLLIPILVLAGSDFGEWSNFAVTRLVRGAGRAVPMPVFLIVALAACGWIAYDGLQHSTVDNGGGGMWQELAWCAAITAIGALLYRLAKPRGPWQSTVPFMALAAVAIVDTVSGFVVQAKVGDTDEHLDDYIQLASAGIWLVAAVAAVVLLAARRGRLSPAAVLACIFVIFVGLTDLLGTLWVLGNFDNPPLGINADNAPYLGPDGIRAFFAIVAIVVMAAALVARRLTAWRRPLFIVVGMAWAFQVLSWIDELYTSRGKLEGDSIGTLAVGGSIILLVALLWDLAVSGEAITNVEGRHFPRDTRILMFLGYILLVSSAVLLFSSLHDERGKLLESAFDPEQWVQQGILFLGVPIILTSGLAALRRWRDGTGSEAHGHAEAPGATPHTEATS